MSAGNTRAARRGYASTNALRDCQQASDHFYEARKQYHLALIIASERGHGAEEIATALGTKALYIANTLRAHREGDCGCQAP